jgi:hypothetical protein
MARAYKVDALNWRKPVKKVPQLSVIARRQLKYYILSRRKYLKFSYLIILRKIKISSQILDRKMRILAYKKSVLMRYRISYMKKAWIRNIIKARKLKRKFSRKNRFSRNKYFFRNKHFSKNKPFSKNKRFFRNKYWYANNRWYQKHKFYTKRRTLYAAMRYAIKKAYRLLFRKIYGYLPRRKKHKKLSRSQYSTYYPPRRKKHKTLAKPQYSTYDVYHRKNYNFNN